MDSQLSQVTTNFSAHQMRIDKFITSAISLVGSKWVHTGRTPGKAVDCVGVLVLSCRKAKYRCDDLLHYSRYPDGETLVAELRSQLDEIPVGDRRPGDVLVMTFSKSRVAQHVGIVTYSGMVHSWQSFGKVVEHCLDDHWLKRVTHAFRLREDRWQR